jgi:putative ABC transport system permease protein
MLKNYLKIAWRNLLSNKVSSLINIGGLAIGMAVSFMLLLYVYNEFSFDQFHANNGHLYQVFKNQPRNGEIATKNITPGPLAAALKKDFPEVENTARLSENMYVLLKYNNKALKLNTMAADPSLLQIFDLDFASGNRTGALADRSSIVITASVAKALFGNADPIGQVVQFNNKFPLKVSAVIKDHPQNSSFTFKALIPWDAFMDQQPWLKEIGWDNYAYATYVLLKPGASAQFVNDKIKDLIGKHFAPDKEIKLFMYPFNRLHLYGEFKNGVSSGGNIAYVRLFLFLAIGILLIACINFMNLSTARSERRAREVGIRKAMGAQRFGLIGQFMGESLLMALLSFLVAMTLMIILLPVFVNAIHIPLSIPYTNVWAWCIALTVTLFTGLVAGSYPAFFLSSFNPVKVLKGQFTATKSSVRPRQVLVVIQFTFAVCLILSSIFIYKQISYIAGRPVGYERSGLVEMPVDGALYDKFESFRQDAIATGAITEGALISEPITALTNASWKNIWPGQLPGEDKIPIDCIAATYHFISTYQFKLLEGRDFEPSVKTDSTAIILNRAAVKLMRLQNPLGQTIRWMDADRKVIGVVKDFVLASPYEPVKPTIIGFVGGWAGNIGLRLNPKQPVSKSLAMLESVYKKYNPSYPFEYTFTDESFNKKFQNEKLLGTMAVVFTCLAIIISCLGLFGLASFSAEQRRKEISIRKVLGASVPALWFKLSQEFIKLIIISFIIGSAISWYNVDRWLMQYTYHTSVSVDVFVLTFVLSLLICLLAVSWQAIKAAWVTPVKNLRSE